MGVSAGTTLRILAVDGGGSALRLRHSEAAGSPVLEAVGRDGGSAEQLVGRVRRGWQEAGSPAVDRAVLGLTTAPSPGPAALAIAARVGKAIAAREVWLCDDAVTSHAGALSLGWGVSVVAGTGVACLVVPESRAPRILGGHGHLLGDEGGAFWIGREGIRAALRATEGRARTTTDVRAGASPAGASPASTSDLRRRPTGTHGGATPDAAPGTALVAAAEARFGRLGDLHVRLHEDPRAVNTIAHFAPDVLAVADDDPEAERIVAEAACELRDLVLAAAALAGSAAGRAGSAPVPVALGGRLLPRDTVLRRALDGLLAAEHGIAPRTADATPLDGAMLLGRQPDPGRYDSLVTRWMAAS